MKTLRLLLFALLYFCQSGSAAQQQVPNILFFLVDDMGIQDCSVPFIFNQKGEPQLTPLNKRYRTPHLERLAANGRRFTNACAYSVCSPTRVTILTGQYAPRHRVTNWTHPISWKNVPGTVNIDGLRSPNWRCEGVDRWQPLLPQLLREAGYRTIHCGKAHFGPNDTPSGEPKILGFDVNIAGHGAGGPGSYWGEKNYSARWRGDQEGIWDVPGLEKYHGTTINLTEALTLEMATVLEESVQLKKPFFAYMSHYAVHAPFEVDSRFAENYPGLEGKALAFATMVEGMDKSLGDLVAKLEKLGVAENTLVIFTSDNGSDGIANRPLRGKKGTRFEGGFRVPLVVAWAKPNPDNVLQKRLSIPAGSVEDDIVTCADFMPTLVRLGGGQIPVGSVIDGKDITPYFRGIPGTHRRQEFLSHFPHKHNNTLFSTYRNGNWKIIYTYQNRHWELYNTALDIGEENDLINAEPQLALNLAQQMIRSLDGLHAQYPIDAETGKPVKPDLRPLEEGVSQISSIAPPDMLEADTLNLGARILPISEANIFKEEGYFTWCNNIIKGDDRQYHLFYVRWPRQYGFYGWLTHSEIARAVSEHPAGPYTPVEKILPARGNFSWNQITAHNVKIKRFNGKYYLYFISTNDGGRNFSEKNIVATAKTRRTHSFWPILRNNQRTGVAVADALSGPWQVLDKPVIEPAGPISTVTVNPGIWRGQDGKYKMIIKGDRPPRVVQALGISDSPEGPFVIQPDLVFFMTHSEDASVWHDSERKLDYAILHDTRGFGLLVSEDGVKWQKARHFRVTGTQIKRRDGTLLKASRFERPAVYVENDIPRVLSAAVQIDGGKDAFIVTIPLTDKGE